MNENTRKLARNIRSAWLRGAPPDARAALLEHPELGEDRSAVVDLAYEEFCLLRAAGHEVDREGFCARFPGCRSALRQMLAVDLAIGAASQLLGTPSPPREEDWPALGSELCDCVLLRPLGQGAFSRVYLATERLAGHRPVVLKVSRLATGEGATLGRLGHDHIVPMLWSRQDPAGGWYVVCMPFHGAATLIHVLDRLYREAGGPPPASSAAILGAIASTVEAGDPEPIRPVTGESLEGLSFVKAVARLARGLARTLAHLHRGGLAHGDLKPANVLLASGGQPLLLDFNLSRGGAGEVVRVGGTFPYMAPEHLRSFLDNAPLPRDDAKAADVFSLAVILYELLTGALPFGAPSGTTPIDCAREMLGRQAQGYRPVDSLNPRVPARLARLIDRCLVAEGPARPTAEEVAAALQERPSRLRGWAAVAAGVLLAIALPAAGVVFSPESPKLETEDSLRATAQSHIGEGRKLRGEGRNEEAHRKFAEGDEALSKAIEARKKGGAKFGKADDYFARGQAQLLLGDAAQANAQFLQALEIHRAANGGGRHGPTLAYLAYCNHVLRQHSQAKLFAEQALEAGHRTAPLLNNLAYGLIQQGDVLRQQSDADKALRYLGEALRRDPKCIPAYRNRAVLAYRLNRDGTLPAHALADIDRAIQLSNAAGRDEPAGLYLLGVELYARAAIDAKGQRGPEPGLYRRKTADYLARAAVLGADVQPLTRHPLVKEVVTREQLAKAAGVKKGPPLTSVDSYLVEPR